MKLLNSVGPNPRKVRMFLHEKGIELPLEEIQALGIAKTRVGEFGDIQLHAPQPHARLGALLGIAADERGIRVQLFQILADGHRFAEQRAVVELK